MKIPLINNLDPVEQNMLQAILLTALTMCALILWHNIYPYTCFSLVIPGYFVVVITAGRFVASMHRRRYWASYYLKDDSSLYYLVTGKTFSMIQAVITGIVYTCSLSAFAALGGPFEIAMLVFNGLLALILYPFASTFVQRHAAIGMSRLATKRLLTFSCFTITAAVYVAILLNTKMPGYIDPHSLKASVNAASQQIASQCDYINISLKWIQEFTATQWYFMVAGTGLIESPWLKYAGWLIFLSFSSLALIGMSLLSSELTVFSSRHTRFSGNHQCRLIKK